MSQSGEDSHHGRGQKKRPENKPAVLEKKKSEKIGERSENREADGAQPKVSVWTRLKGWVAINLFSGLLTLFTIIYACSFIAGTYLTERAYVVFARPDGVIAQFLNGDVGVAVFFTNSGRTPAGDVVTQIWMLREKQVVIVAEHLPSISRRMVPSGYPGEGDLIWPGAPDEIARVKSEQTSVGITGRVEYTDMFYIRHCVEFAANYLSALRKFQPTGVLGLCNPIVKSVRYSRVCVPTPDHEDGTWIATWEAFTAEKPGSESPTSDPTPCLKRKHQQNHTEPKEQKEPNTGLSRPS